MVAAAAMEVNALIALEHGRAVVTGQTTVLRIVVAAGAIAIKLREGGNTTTLIFKQIIMIYRRLFFILILFFLSKNIQSQNKKTIICGKINPSGKFIINIYEPIYGYYNIAFLDTSSLNSSLINHNDSIFKSINIDHPSFITIYFRNENKEFLTRSEVLLFPGDSIHFNFDLNHSGANAIKYGGSNAMGQKLFNEINFEPYNKFIPVFETLDKLPENKNTFIQEIENIVLSMKSRFDSLQKKFLITKSFVGYMDICFKALIYDQVVVKFLRESKKSNIINRGEKDSIISALYKNQPPNDKRLKGLYATYFYLCNYYNFITYKKYNLKSINELKSKIMDYPIKSHHYAIREDFVPFIYIGKEEDKKDLWALYMLLLFQYPGKYDSSIVAQYDSIFSATKWSHLLQKKFAQSGVAKKINYTLRSPVEFIDMNGINSVQDVLKKLPNKYTFVDIWATWCGPCVAAFGFNDQLDTFLINNHIQRLYISLDETDKSSKWKQAIDRYALGGYHILATDSLKEDIKENIYHTKGNVAIPIPRYLLVNKGKVVIQDTFSPTEFEFLKKEIMAVLTFD